MEGERSTGVVISLMLILWVAGVIFALGNIREDGPGSVVPTPGQSPVPIPTEVVVGTSLDPNTGLITEPTTRIGAGATIAFSVWMGARYGSDEVLVSLARLEPAGFKVVGEAHELPADPDSPVLTGQLPADLVIDVLGPGTYLLDVQRPTGERIGYGVLQLETDAPEDIEVFVKGGWKVAVIATGEHTGYQFGADGEIVAKLTETLNEDAFAWSNHRATFAGQDYLFIIDGPWASHYLPEPGSVRLDVSREDDG